MSTVQALMSRPAKIENIADFIMGKLLLCSQYVSSNLDLFVKHNCSTWLARCFVFSLNARLRTCGTLVGHCLAESTVASVEVRI